MGRLITTLKTTTILNLWICVCTFPDTYILTLQSRSLFGVSPSGSMRDIFFRQSDKALPVHSLLAATSHTAQGGSPASCPILPSLPLPQRSRLWKGNDSRVSDMQTNTWQHKCIDLCTCSGMHIHKHRCTHTVHTYPLTKWHCRKADNVYWASINKTQKWSPSAQILQLW